MPARSHARTACSLIALLGLLCATPPAFADTTTYTYDALGRVISSTEPDGTVIQYTYDPAGNRLLKSATPPGSNHNPTAVNDSGSVAANGSLTLDPRSNDSDTDGDSLTLSTIPTGPTHGTVTIQTPPTSILYTPATNYAGADSFTYSLSDGHGGTATATVSITVTTTNHAPVANADSVSTTAGSALTFDPRSNDTDADSNPLTVIGASTPSHGTTSYAGGSVTYTPTSGYAGSDSFTYTISDGQPAGTAVGSVSVTVTSANVPPVANADSVTTAANTPLTFDPRVNDTDANGNNLTITAATSPAHGSASYTGTSITYTPTTGYAGSDGLSYTISDGAGGTATAAVTITVTSTNHAPVANADSVTTASGSAVTFDPRTNDTDADGNALTVTGATTPSHGSTSYTGTSVSYTPSSGYSGADSFSYTISDGAGGAATGSVSVTVTAGNQPPVAVADSIYFTTTTIGVMAYDVYVLANDTDSDGDTLTITGFSPPTNATASIVSGHIHLTGLHLGTTTFTYTISDGHGHTATATVTIDREYDEGGGGGCQNC
jgi:YD repeat-containing protein